MNEFVLMGRGDRIQSLPRAQWEGHLARVPQHAGSRLAFMSEAHHQVRYFAVRELPRTAEPLPTEFIARSLGLALAEVETILDELERHLTFLVRDRQGAVAWAFPVTVDPTPHQLTFRSGERLYGAWAEDAMAVPFVQGQLRNERVSVTIETECAHCQQPIHMTVDSVSGCELHTGGAQPLVFEPKIDWDTFIEPNIIHAY
jgi:hypothetical protein